MTRVTAMVPTYNGATFVAETLASLCAQDHADLEILVSVDASTDGTLEVCRAAAAADLRIRVLAQPTRLGWIGNCDALLHAARTPLVFYAPHDDLFAATYVRRCVEALAERPDAVLAYAGTRWTKLDGSVLDVTTPVAVDDDPVRRGAPYLRHRNDDHFFAFRGVMRAGVLRDVGGLRHGFAPAADGHLLFRLAMRGPFVHVPDLLVHKRQHESSTALEFRYHPWRARLAYLPEILLADLTWVQRRRLLGVLASELRRTGRQRARYRRRQLATTLGRSSR